MKISKESILKARQQIADNAQAIPGIYITEKMERMKAGYYLVKKSNGMRYFISEEVNYLALDRVASKVLTDTGFDYKVEKLGVNGMWWKSDFSSRFIDQSVDCW